MLAPCKLCRLANCKKKIPTFFLKREATLLEKQLFWKTLKDEYGTSEVHHCKKQIWSVNSLQDGTGVFYGLMQSSLDLSFP